MNEISDKKYSIILSDPPWKYNARNNKNTRFGCGAIGHYELMKTEDICALPVGDIAEENCALFLWATWPKIEEAFKVIEAWGFKYKTLGFIWIKLNKDGKPFFGIGHYTKSNSEPCLLCTRGKVKAASNYVSQVIMSQKGAHSEKPAIVREKIVQLLGDKPRIELFARQRVENWNCWGKEAPLTVGARD